MWVSGAGLASRLTQSIVPARDGAVAWELVLKTPTDATLAMDLGALPQGYRVSVESEGRRWTDAGHVPVPSGQRAFRISLVRERPQATQLLANYPNPFNPETWIPFELSDAADVSVTIYDLAGGVVRQLDVGHRDAGYHTRRGEAVRWDGRNATGELVSSGAYVYELRAGSSRHMRRLVIRK